MSETRPCWIVRINCAGCHRAHVLHSHEPFARIVLYEYRCPTREDWFRVSGSGLLGTQVDDVPSEAIATGLA
jgi:hypothetical protein